MYFDAGTISFPGLGITGINPPRTLPFTIFGKEIYLYGVIIAFGFLLAILYAKRRVKDFGTDFDRVTDAILFAVPAAILCARIYYVIFRWDLYKDNPISALYIWQGGIAIYGGVIGAILGLLLFAKVKKQRLAPYLDIMALGLLIGQFIGRWGNFFNREAYGAEIFSDFFLRMGIQEADGAVRYWHPTFLYESLWNCVGFVLLHFLSRKRRYDGQTFLQYVAWYGLGRVWIEGLRTDSLYLAGTDLRVSQLLAGLSFVAAVGVMLYVRLFRQPRPAGQGADRFPKEPETEAEPEALTAEAEAAEAAETPEAAEEAEAPEGPTPEAEAAEAAETPEAPEAAEEAEAPEGPTPEAERAEGEEA